VIKFLGEVVRQLSPIQNDRRNVNYTLCVRFLYNILESYLHVR